MDNYLLMGHILRCKMIPKDEVHPGLWIGANRKFRRVPMEKIEKARQNKVCLHSDGVVRMITVTLNAGENGRGTSQG